MLDLWHWSELARLGVFIAPVRLYSCYSASGNLDPAALLGVRYVPMLADNEVVMDEGGKRAWFYVDESQDDVALFFETPLQAFEYAMKKWGTQL